MTGPVMTTLFPAPSDQASLVEASNPALNCTIHYCMERSWPVLQRERWLTPLSTLCRWWGTSGDAGPQFLVWELLRTYYAHRLRVCAICRAPNLPEWGHWLHCYRCGCVACASHLEQEPCDIAWEGTGAPDSDDENPWENTLSCCVCGKKMSYLFTGAPVPRGTPPLPDHAAVDKMSLLVPLLSHLKAPKSVPVWRRELRLSCCEKCKKALNSRILVRFRPQLFGIEPCGGNSTLGSPNPRSKH